MQIYIWRRLVPFKPTCKFMFREDHFPLKQHTHLHFEQTSSLWTNTQTHSPTLSRYHPAPMPVLSCSMRIFFMGPTQFVFTRNVSLLPRLNMVLLLFFRWILRVVPVLPNKVTKTLALVPPPITSPVTVTISYSEKQNCEMVTYPHRNINITETKQKQKKKRNQTVTKWLFVC